MQSRLSPIFQLFDQQYTLAQKNFNALSKQFKSKKAVDLEEKLIFLEIYIDLLSRVYFSEKKLKFQLFSPFREIFKSLKKVLHIKLIHQACTSLTVQGNSHFSSYEHYLEKDKKEIYTASFETILGTPLEIWENLYREAYEHSKDLKPLMINTATNQIINEELEFFKFDSEKKLGPKEIKDIYEGLQVIIALENFRMVAGLNATFTAVIHQQMNDLSQLLYSWYQNHLFLQHMTFFLADKEALPNKKYIDLIKHIKNDKKKLTNKVVSQCQHLFTKVLA